MKDSSNAAADMERARKLARAVLKVPKSDVAQHAKPVKKRK